MLESTPLGSHIVVSQKQRRAWRACGHCGEWNLADQDETAAILTECVRHLDDDRPAVTFAGFRTKLLREFQLTEVDCDTNVELLTERYKQRMAIRSKRAFRLGNAVKWLVVASVMGCALGIGGVEGAITGVLIAFGGLAAANAIQRKRTFVLQLNEGEPITMSRAMANEAFLACDGAGLLLQAETFGGTRVFRGDRALEVLGKVLDRTDTSASSAQIHEAAAAVEASSLSEQAICNILQGDRGIGQASTKRIGDLRGATRLALGMIASLGRERAMLEQEAAILEGRLARASELAQIIDSDLRQCKPLR